MLDQKANKEEVAAMPALPLQKIPTKQQALLSPRTSLQGNSLLARMKKSKKYWTDNSPLEYKAKSNI